MALRGTGPIGRDVFLAGWDGCGCPLVKMILVCMKIARKLPRNAATPDVVLILDSEGQVAGFSTGRMETPAATRRMRRMRTFIATRPCSFSILPFTSAFPSDQDSYRMKLVKEHWIFWGDFPRRRA